MSFLFCRCSAVALGRGGFLEWYVVILFNCDLDSDILFPNKTISVTKNLYVFHTASSSPEPFLAAAWDVA